MNNKAINEFGFHRGNLASVDNTLLDLLNSSHPAQPHSLIAKNTEFTFTRFSTS